MVQMDQFRVQIDLFGSKMTFWDQFGVRSGKYPENIIKNERILGSRAIFIACQDDNILRKGCTYSKVQMDLYMVQIDLFWVKHDILGPICLQKWKISRKHNQKRMILGFQGHFF